MNWFTKRYEAAVLDAFTASLAPGEKIRVRTVEAAVAAPRTVVAKLAELLGAVKNLGLKTASEYIELAIDLREKRGGKTAFKRGFSQTV